MSSQPQVLNARQIDHVLELIEINLLAPREAILKLEALTEAGEFTQAECYAIRMLLVLDHRDMVKALREASEDDEALALVRDRLVHEARVVCEGG
ncbi:hypothetical protein VAR608DRAFT_2661 [Variovorax sp. HW608]|uniref:hypothetical protein n=1 Tax=Variovorax sp. HW608 TaxID=1034889 RepID=UPI00081F7A63|nr:hypothetical protein [Variovorax sp. HW608]SCK31198.1 hypothetical protein VAR608DRAFT_2661 [Variovorax sp. HW608]